MGTRTINITLSDEEYDNVLKTKEKLNLTWIEFIKKATKCLGKGEN